MKGNLKTLSLAKKYAKEFKVQTFSELIEKAKNELLLFNQAKEQGAFFCAEDPAFKRSKELKILVGTH